MSSAFGVYFTQDKSSTDNFVSKVSFLPAPRDLGNKVDKSFAKYLLSYMRAVPKCILHFAENSMLLTHACERRGIIIS